MSRAINTSLATIQFQVNARQANAAMQALQNMSNDLNSSIDKVKKNIENLGKNVPADNPQLLNYQSQLAGLKKDLKDVEKAQRDFLKGAKAADQLWQAATNGTIESLSFRSIKAGVNGLKKRQEGLSPGDAQDMKDWRIIKEVIDEADRVVKQAGADVQNVVQTIREGGKVSEQTMRQTINTLKELKGSVDETDADFRTYGSDLDFMEAKLQEFSDAQRRAKGEIVDANDARREMNKLTEEGRRQAEFQKQQAEWEVRFYEQKNQQLEVQRQKQQAAIDQTKQQMDAQQQLIEQKHSQLAADEESFNKEQQTRHTKIDGMKQEARTARDLADEKKEIADEQIETEKYWQHQLNETGQKITDIKTKLEELRAAKLKPQVDTSDVDKLKAELADIESQLTGMGDRHTADMKAFNERLWKKQDRMKEIGTQQYLPHTTDPNGDYYNFGNKAKKIIKSFAAGGDDRRYDLMQSLAERGGYLEKLKELESEHRAIVKQRTEYYRAMDETGKNDWEEAIRQLDELDGMYSTVINILKDYKQEFDKIKPADDAHLEKYEQLTERRATLLEKIASIEQQSASATNQDTEAVKNKTEALKELEDAQKQLTGRKNWLSQQEGYLKENLDVLKQIGLKEEDLADEGKVREAVEKKVLEIMQAQANVEKEVAEQQQKMIAGLKDNALGGTKADRDYYLKNRDNYNLGDYATPDDVMERIAHLEMVSKLKNGKKFSDETSWDPDDELDEDEAIVMNDKERENIKNELRILKQHVREEILKAIREAGDIDKGVENATGGDGVSEDARFGKELNDKISALKDKIHESIETTIESYSDILGEDIDRETPLTKEQLTARVKGTVSTISEDLARDHESIGWAKEDVQDAEALVAAKQKQVDAIKAGTQATAESNEKTEEEIRLEGELKDNEEKHATAQSKLNDAKRDSATATGEYVEANKKAEEQEGNLAKATKEADDAQVKHDEHMKDGLDTIGKMAQGYETLKTQLEGQEQALADTGKQMAENNQHIAESEAKKKQAQELTIKRMEEMIAALRKENNEVIPANTEKWRENEAEINRLSGALEKLKETARIDLIKTQGLEALSFFEKDAAGRSQADTASAAETAEKVKALAAYRDVLPKDTDVTVFARIDEILEEQAKLLKEATGEWMSYEDAKELASKAGGEGFIATKQQMQQAVQAMERQRDSLIKTIQLKQKDGKATADEEAHLEKLEQELKDLKFEQDNFNMSHKKMQDLLSEPTKATDLDELKAAIKRADGELKRMEGSLGQNNKQYQEFAAQVKNAKNQLKEMEGQAKATSTAWEKAWSRLKTYVGMYMGFNAVWQKMVGTADDLMQLSDKMGEVRKTTGFTADEAGRLSDNLAKLDTRTSLTGLMEFSSLAGSIGMKTQEQVQGFTEAANMLAVSLPEMGNEASRTLMKIADATGDLEKNGGNVRETLERVGSTIIALRANSAAAAGPITDFVSRVGAVGAQAGISIDQIAALGATVDALGGRVEMSATALSRMIPAIKNNTFEVAKAIGMTEKELKNMTGMEQMVAIFRKLHDSAKGFDTSTEEGMNAMADSVEKALGRSTSMQEVMKELNQQGARAGIVFGLLSQNVDKLEEQLDTAGNAYRDNIALMNEYNKMNDTAAAKWARLKNQLEEFFVSADNTSWLSDLIDTLRTFVDMLTDEGPFGRLLRWSVTYWAMLKAKWTEAIGTALISLGKFLAATQASTAATAADTAAKTADAAATEATAVANEHAAVAAGKFNKTMKANIVAAVATAVVALGFALYEYAQKAKKAANQVDILADVEKKAKEESIKERAELEKLYKVTQDQTASMEERKKALKDMVGDAKYQEYYSKLSSESELASAAASAYKELSEQILATARARALDAKAEELQARRIELEDQKKDREDWEKENRGRYRQGQQQYQQQQRYVGRVTGGATAGFQESQIAQQGAAAMKPAIIDEFEGSVKERNRIDGEIEQIDKDIDKLKQQVSKLNIKTDTGNGGNGGGGGGNNNPYGDYNKVTSPYSQWNGDDLVARRKEMLERVRALANGADVQKVLSEDAKFISDAVRKNIKTTSDAIEWYNTERLKIQEALHAKHLTNTGDWMDPKQQKIRRKLMQDDMKAYLEELDAYYTERKTEIDRARNDEEISEAEAWNRNIKNEAEWHKRRAELQIMYSNKHKQVAEDEQDAISAIVAERTGDDAKYIKATIANTRKFSEAVKAMNDQGAKEYRKFQGDLGLGSEKDWNKVEKALGQHLKAIEDIINKERPFNGIAKNMRDNLGKMGILTADLAEGADSAAEELKRITFLLGEAENAYTMTVEKLLDDMRQHGFKEWADVISKDPSMQQGMLAMLRMTFDSVQDAIKKESSIIKKQVEIMMQDITDQVQADTTRMQIMQNSVSRANSLIGAGTASERVADKLAIKQIQLQITMQETRIRMLKKAGADRVALLYQEAELLQKQGKTEEAKQKRMDAENVDKSVGLTLTKEQVELDKQRVALSEKLEETQNRLYTELREWASLLTSSMQSIFEASHAGDADYYNELAKMNLTGKGGPGAGTYIVIDNEGTEDATAHYEYLNERQALERQHEIEIENARAEAWKKVWDDINMKINDSITDWMNAYLQNQSIDANTAVVDANTLAIKGLTEQLAQGLSVNISTNSGGESPAETPADNGFASDKQAYYGKVSGQNATPDTPTSFESSGDFATDRAAYFAAASGATDPMAVAQVQMDANDAVTQNTIDNKQRQVQVQTQGDKQIASSNQSTIAKMIQATNLYGVAYQAMSNDNLDAAQKFQMIALQAVGNVAMVGLQVALTEAFGKTAVNEAQALSKDNAENGSILGPILWAIGSALVGGLMGLAASKIASSKSQIAQMTGASVGAGRLATGMLTYAEGNVNEFSDPNSLTPGRHYNVDGADGKTYRAKYMGEGAKTHITNGPEFHLVGEKGREAIIDAGTTRQITLNEPEIWGAIKTLYNGGSLRHTSTRRGRGVRAFAEGNLDEFEMADGGGMMAESGFDPAMLQGFQQSLDRNSAIMEQIAANGIEAFVSPYGPRGIVAGYDKGKKEAMSHGEKHL